MPMVEAGLPPQIVLEQHETLHQIALPPLATFLAGLCEARHLLRLHEILEQYRTPSSYHRVDVREISSSELPPGDDAQHKLSEDELSTNAGGPSSSAARERGRPIILQEGISLQQHLEQQAGHDGSAADAALECRDLAGEAHGTALEQATFRPFTEDSAIKLPPRETRSTSTGVQDVQTPLPPTGPSRRVRELRLDLRTLDAAALFTLETWRREELQLDKLDMEVPASIWYQKDRSPSPEPVIEPKRPRGRPRKSAVPTVKDRSEHRTETEAGAAGSPADAIGQTPAAQTNNDNDTAADATVGLPETLASGQADANRPSPAAGPSRRSPSRYELSPSPGEILPDAYNEAEENDPDFVPIGEERKAKRLAAAAAIVNGPDGQPKKRRGRPPKRSLDLPDASAVSVDTPAEGNPDGPRDSAIPSDPGMGIGLPPGDLPNDLTPSIRSPDEHPVSPPSASPLAGVRSTPVQTGESASNSQLPDTPQPPYRTAGAARKFRLSVEIKQQRRSSTPKARRGRTSSTAKSKPKDGTQPKEDDDEDWAFLKAFR